MLRDNRRDAHNSYRCHGALTCLPPLDLVVHELRIDSAVWDVGSTFTPVNGTAVYQCGFSNWTPYSILGSMLWGQHITLNPSIESLCWLANSRPEDLGLLQQSKGSSGIQMGPERWGELRSVFMGNLCEEGSVSLQENRLQFSGPRLTLSWPVLMKFRWMLDKRSTLVLLLIVRWLWKLLGLPK